MTIQPPPRRPPRDIPDQAPEEMPEEYPDQTPPAFDEPATRDDEPDVEREEPSPD
ncbi:MAG: hypothetical protein ACM33T_17215 [Solirubrobacterales bacterium]